MVFRFIRAILETDIEIDFKIYIKLSTKGNGVLSTNVKVVLSAHNLLLLLTRN